MTTITTDPDTESRTPEEWERDNLAWACQSLDDAWSSVLRAMAHDTRHVPGTYRLAINRIRAATSSFAAMAREREGMSTQQAADALEGGEE